MREMGMGLGLLPLPLLPLPSVLEEAEEDDAIALLLGEGQVRAVAETPGTGAAAGLKACATAENDRTKRSSDGSSPTTRRCSIRPRAVLFFVFH